MKVVLDTNIYLNFFRKKDDQSLVLIDLLIKLIDEKKFELLLPTQIVQEFYYNKNWVILDQIFKLKNGLSVEAPLPHFLCGSKEYNSLKKAIKSLKKIQEITIKQYVDRAINPKSTINTKISKLFSKAISLESNQADILELAYSRAFKKFTPKKQKQELGELGDSIIWETLIKECGNDSLTIISVDGDWSEKDKLDKINNVLKVEWRKKTSGKTLSLYRNLQKFINDQSPNNNKPILEELVKEEEKYLSGGILDVARAYMAQHNDMLTLPWDNVTTTRGIATQVCSCCEKSFQSNPYSLTTIAGGGNKCPDCEGLFIGECKTCKKCGKHYHDGIMSFSLTTLNLCSDCESNPRISLTDTYIN